MPPNRTNLEIFNELKAYLEPKGFITMDVPIPAASRFDHSWYMGLFWGKPTPDSDYVNIIGIFTDDHEDKPPTRLTDDTANGRTFKILLGQMYKNPGIWNRFSVDAEISCTATSKQLISRLENILNSKMQIRRLYAKLTNTLLNLGFTPEYDKELNINKYIHTEYPMYVECKEWSISKSGAMPLELYMGTGEKATPGEIISDSRARIGRFSITTMDEDSPKMARILAGLTTRIRLGAMACDIIQKKNAELHTVRLQTCNKIIDLGLLAIRNKFSTRHWEMLIDYTAALSNRYAPSSSTLPRISGELKTGTYILNGVTQHIGIEQQREILDEIFMLRDWLITSKLLDIATALDTLKSSSLAPETIKLLEEAPTLTKETSDAEPKQGQ